MKHTTIKIIGIYTLSIVFGGIILILPAFASGQSSSIETPRIGLLAWSSCEWTSLFRGLRDLGYKPGETLTIECRSAGGNLNNLSTATANLVDLEVDVILAASHLTATAARDATDTIPIVSIVSGDPVATGLARSLAKPGGNLTGVSYYAMELTAKRLELLKEMVPRITRVDVLTNPVTSHLPYESDTKRAGRLLDVAVKIHQISKPEDLSSAFATMKAENAQAVFVLPNIILAQQIPRIAALALEHRLPTMSWSLRFTKGGFLMAYSAKYGKLMYRLAHYVDRILKGANPGDLPIEQPMLFNLSINLKTAKALDIEVPQTLLLLADEIIQ